MSVQPERQYFMEELGAILEDYTEWYSRILRSVYYAKNLEGTAQQPKPVTLIDWAEEGLDKGLLDANIVETIKGADAEFAESAAKFARNAQNDTTPSLEEFDEFRTMFEDFYGRVRRIERDSQLADSGVDTETGMRSMSVFDRDLKRELERRARSDNPFCLDYIRIDRTDLVTDDALKSDLVQKAAEGVMACLRTFDDAYRKSDYEFILCLKNTDYPGANAALNRINRYYNQQNIVFVVDGAEKAVTVSGTIAEVIPTDDIGELIDNMAKDVMKHADEPGTVLQFQELSQLQRFVKGIGE